jgi:aryl-alcohol dehydrogenase-like predicted oxidoreductase
MTTTLNAAASGTFSIGGDMPVNRLGFGAMRVTGEGVWGLPADLEGAKATLRRTVALGINFIDTADSYGPAVSEDLIRETLHPYKDVVIATKGGLTRTGPGEWEPVGRSGYLQQCVQMSLRRLAVDRIDLWQLHRIDEETPRKEQFETIAKMQQDGFIRHVGLSEVSVADIEEAQNFFKVATVQNMYNLVERKSERVLDYCEKHNIGFIPWFPLAAGDLAKPGSALSEIARRLQATPSQIALAWILKRSRVMLPIPGTSKVAHLEENVRASSLQLSDDDFAELDKQAKSAAR